MTSYDRYLREKYQATASAVVPDLAPVLDEHLESDRSHLHSYHVSLWIPMMQSIITALLFALDVLLIAYVVKNKLFGEYWSWAVMTFMAVLTVSWLLLLERWLNLTIPLERFLKRDINHDGFIGAPQPTRTVRVDIRNGDKQRIYATLPDTPTALEFYRTILQGFSTAEREWVGAGKPLEPKIYDTIRDELLARSLARWVSEKDIRQGWELTPLGRHALREIVNNPPTEG